MFTQKEKEDFFNAVESLKKYRRADLVDERGRDLLEKLYIDPLPNDHILKKSMKDNTTFLIGRKGTGKSTIFLRIEQELRKTEKSIPCYIDVKTVYESAQTEYVNLEYLSEFLDGKTLQKYLIERSFLQSVLKSVVSEISKRHLTTIEKIKQFIGLDKAHSVKVALEDLGKRIDDNEILKQIEIPIIKKIGVKQKTFDEKINETKQEHGLKEAGASISEKGIGASFKLMDVDTNKEELKKSSEIEEKFSSVFLQVFQIKQFIEDVKLILKELNIQHLVVLLDDFSEIDDYAIESFVDVLLAPLNNWSEEFIKFKIAAYPNRIYYGKIDPGKVDTINLDFYNLYSEFDRNKMEEGAIDFTKRLIEKRITYYTSKTPSDFFDTSKSNIGEYYELLFQTSMNVPRIIGYILSYCYQSKIIYDKKILKSDIEAAAQKYYDDKIDPFFHKTTFSLLSLNEKVDILQLRELLNKITDRLKEIKRKIANSEYSGESYILGAPYASHFYFIPDLEKFLRTLELNYFISKYTEMSDKDGKVVSIYCINYGLAYKNNLPWGKPKGAKYGKYFTQRPFDFNITIKEFLASAKSIHCVNPQCNATFTQDQMQLLEFAKFKCNKCGSDVIIESVSENIKNDLKEIESSNLLHSREIEIVMELSKQNKALFAREIGEELDLSSQSIAQKGRHLDEKKGLVKRDKTSTPYSYELTDLAKKIYK